MCLIRVNLEVCTILGRRLKKVSLLQFHRNEEYWNLKDYVGSFPLTQRVICALTALEMILPIWLDYEAELPRHLLDRGVFRETIKACYSFPDVSVARSISGRSWIAVRRAGDSDNSSAFSAALAANVTVHMVLGESWTMHICPVVVATYASDAICYDRVDDKVFIFRWWSRCRTRLAFAEANKAEITW